MINEIYSVGVRMIQHMQINQCDVSHVHPWWIHVNVWQNQYNIIKLKKKNVKKSKLFSIDTEKHMTKFKFIHNKISQ